MAKVNYTSLDIAKFGCALLIICAHTAAEVVTLPRIVDTPLSLYVVAVPFFYTCSSFLFFVKFNTYHNSQRRWEAYRRFSVRVLSLYGVWTAVYFPFVAFDWMRSGVSSDDILAYLYRTIVFTGYPTIWFLNSLFVAVTFVYLLKKRLSYPAILAIGVVFYIIGTLGYSYAGITRQVPFLSELYEGLNAVFITTRNGVFNGFPFAALGAFIASSNRRFSRRNSLGFCLLFGASFVTEAVLLKACIGFPVGGADTVIFLFPFTYFFFQWLLSNELVDRSLFRWMRNISLLMFLSQRLFLTAIPSVLPPSFMNPLRANAALGMLVMTGSTVIFSAVVVELSKKHRWLRFLW